MDKPKVPPTHRAWSQYTEHGQFREWYPTGYAWITKDASGDTVICAVEHSMTVSHERFTWFFPIGKEPPPPPNARDKSGLTDDEPDQ